MTTAYKNKIYTGKSITWNQLVDKSKFQNISSLSGISVINTNDGSVMFDGTKTRSDAVFFSCGTYQITANHKYYLYGAPEGSDNKIYQLYSVYTPTGGTAVYSFDNGSGVFFSGQATASGSGNITIIISQNTVSKIVFTPQLFDLTLMFGAGNEPTTVAEFWSHFDRKHYDYNTGESQPLFTISRKNKIYMGRNITWHQLIQNGNFTSKSNWNIGHIASWSVSNNEATLVSNSSQSYAYFLQRIAPSLQIINHKYLISLDAVALDGSDTTFAVAMHNGSNIQNILQIVTLSPGTNNIHIENIWTASSNYVEDMTSSARLIMYLPYQGGLGKVGYTTKIRNVQMFDLTLMFGAGNEPTTPAEFWSHFNRKYYPYNVGETQPLFTIGRKSQIKEG